MIVRMEILVGVLVSNLNNRANVYRPATDISLGGRMSWKSYVIGIAAVAVFVLWLKSNFELSTTSVVVAFFAAVLFFVVIGKLFHKAD